MSIEKRADGNPQFERSFADLAYAHMKDKAPKLLDYMVGFQVLDKNDDETRAAGIFGFQVGKQWFYAPTFFLAGELKGTELLYIKEQDAFVPLQENWVNYLISRKPAVIGEGTPFNESELGVLAPNFRVYARSPLRGWDKTAAALYDPSNKEIHGYWHTGKLFDLAPAMACFTISPNHQVYKEAAARMDLGSVVKECGVSASRWLVAQIRAVPEYASALGRFYSGTELMPEKTAAVKTEKVSPPSDAVLAAHGLDRSLFAYYTRKIAKNRGTNLVGTDKLVLSILQKQGVQSATQLNAVLDQVLASPEPAQEKVAGVRSKLEVVTRAEGMDNPETLADSEKEELMHDGVVVRDNREDSEKSKVYDTSVTDMLSNPGESGLYEMIDKDGEVYKVLVINGPKTIGAGSAHVALVARVDGKGYTYMRPQDIFIRKALLGEWNEFYDKLPSVTDMSEGKTYTIVGPAAEASLVFNTVQKRDKELMVNVPGAFPNHTGPNVMKRDDPMSYRGAEHDYPTDSIGNLTDTADQDKQWWKSSVRPIVLTEKVNYLRPIGDTLMAPARYKAFELDIKEYGLGFVPASLTDVEILLWKHAGLQRMEIWSDGMGYQIIEKDAVASPRMGSDDMYRCLVLRHGITKAAAKIMLERADKAGSDTFLIKHAAVYRSTGGPLTPGPNAPAVNQLDFTAGYDPMIRTMTSYPQTTYEPVGLPLGSYEDYNPEVLDRPTAQSVIQSSQKGNKEVLDTASLSGMLKSMDSDALIDKYLSDLVVGEDRIGRMLFLFYWHNDKFVDRYGEEEMQELEDVLRNTFKGVGDLVLFLKKKSIEPDVADQGMDVDLGKLT